MSVIFLTLFALTPISRRLYSLREIVSLSLISRIFTFLVMTLKRRRT